jgi:prepilin-type N-terminal cleavage/methylation domain-containing protein
MLRTAASTEPRTRRASRGRGFTLFEVIVVSAMLLILAATVVPRLVVVERQREEKTILEVEDLLRMFAFRNTSGLQQVGLTYDGAAGTLGLWIMDLDPRNPDGARIWQQDRLSSLVEFPDGMGVESVSSDESSIAPDAWTITSHPDGSRPRIDLSLRGKEKSARLVLETYSNSPRRGDDPRAEIREAIDLDAEGSAYDPW